MNYKPIFEKVSQETGIPEEVVSLAYRTFWKFIRETITELNSDNTRQLSLEETKEKIASLDYIQNELNGIANLAK